MGVHLISSLFNTNFVLLIQNLYFSTIMGFKNTNLYFRKFVFLGDNTNLYFRVNINTNLYFLVDINTNLYYEFFPSDDK